MCSELSAYTPESESHVIFCFVLGLFAFVVFLLTIPLKVKSLVFMNIVLGEEDKDARYRQIGTSLNFLLASSFQSLEVTGEKVFENIS